MIYKLVFIAVFIFFSAYSCKKEQVTMLSLFEPVPVASDALPPEINEASGITYSLRHPGRLWVQEDSGNPPLLYLLHPSGKVEKTFVLAGATNRDWEDIAISRGPGAGEVNIYLADIGDNNASRTEYHIYRMPEPDVVSVSISNWQRLIFRYEDRSHDAEALLVDEQQQIYVITKRDSVSGVYKIAQSHAGGEWTARLAVSLPFTGVVSAALSPDAREILVKTYDKVYYWKRAAGETLEKALQRQPAGIGYVPEPQGEAISFISDNTGFYTLSEKAFASQVKLYFYKRK